MGRILKLGVGIVVGLCTFAVQTATDLSGYSSPRKDKEITLLRGDVSPDNSAITITRSGVYRLTGNMTGSGSGTLITISASDVELDLDGSTLSNAENGIVISTGANRVVIKNGSIATMSTAGITLEGNKCVVENVEIVGAVKGIVVSSSVQNSFKNCRILEATSIGIELVSSSTNSFVDCDILDVSSSSVSVYAVKVSGGTANTFKQCSAKGVRASGAANYAYGIAFIGVERSYLTNCMVVDVVSTDAKARGIELDDDCLNCSLVGNSVRYINAPAGTTDDDAIGIKARSDYTDVGGNLASRNYLSDNLSGPVNYGADFTLMAGQCYSTYNAGVTGVNTILIKNETYEDKAGFNIWVKSPSSISQSTPGDPEAEQLNAIESKIEVVDAEVGALTTAVGVIDTEVGEIDTKIGQLGTSIGDVLVDTTAIESKVDVVDAEVGALTTAVGVIDTEVGVVDGKVDTLTTNVAAVDTKTDLLGGSIADVLADTGEIDAKIDLLGGSIADVLSETSIIESMIDNIHIDLTPVEADLFTVDSKLDVLQNTVVDNFTQVFGRFDNVDSALQSLTASELEHFVSTFEQLIEVSDDLLSTMTQVQDIAANVEETLTNLDQILTSVADLDADLNIHNVTMNSKLDTLDIKVDLLGGSIADVLIDTAAIEGKVDTLTTNVGVIDGKVDTLTTNVGAIDGKVDTLTTNVAAVDTKSDLLGSSIADVLADTGEIDVKVDLLGGSIADVLIDAAAIESKVDVLISGVACDATVLTSADVVGGAITLATAGNYCLSENLTSTIYITADNVSLCLNDRELAGCIDVAGKDAVIKNGRIVVPSSLDSVNAITIQVGADYAIVSEVLALVEDGSGARGDALSIAANNVIVKKSIFKGGASSGSTGGKGITVVSSAALATIVDCDIDSSQNDGASIGGSAIDVLDSIITASTLNDVYCVHCVSPAVRVVIKNCRIDGKNVALQTGFAGDGVHVESGCSNIEVRDCSILGCADKAIEDNHNATPTTYSSIMYNNFAYDIAGDTKYQIRNKSSMGESYGVDLVSGTPGIYSNVYIP